LQVHAPANHLQLKPQLLPATSYTSSSWRQQAAGCVSLQQSATARWSSLPLLPAAFLRSSLQVHAPADHLQLQPQLLPATAVAAGGSRSS